MGRAEDASSDGARASASGRPRPPRSVVTVGTTVRAACIAALTLVAACSGGGSGEAASERSAAERRATTTAAPTSTTTAAPTTTTAPVDMAALRPPTAAGDPAGLARQIADAEAVLRRPGASEGEVAAAALAQQVAYRQLGDHPEWDAAVLAALPAELHGVAQSHAFARRELRALAADPATEMPAWQIVGPAPADQLVAWYHEAEAEFGIPWQVLAAINLVETGMGRIRGTSVAGAQGPMQFMPATWATYGEGDVNDHRQAIRAAARYLRANGAPGDMPGALWNYNHSNRYVRSVQTYADLMVEHPGAFAGFYHWGIWYWSTAGDLYLPVGYHSAEKVPVDQYVASIPP
jgi:membrane-bound lytic murein transglycosylase B